jgi:hypothetical protein
MAVGGESDFNSGGGILNSGGAATILSSTLSGNDARYGGGLYVVTSLATTTIVSNSTISDNVAMLGGGGIYNFVGRIVIEFSTITDNQSAANEGSGVASWGDLGTSLTEVFSSIIAANVNTDVDTVGGDISTFQSNDYNLVGSGDAVESFNQPHDYQLTSVQLALGPLADNGGPTLTHLPLGGSRAINAGPENLSGGVGGVPQFDQRGGGFARVNGVRIDIGAVELQIPLPDLIGDYNGDLTVNAADYTVWRNTLGTNVANYAGADGNGNGIIDNADYDVWKLRYGDSLAGSGSGAGDVQTLLLQPASSLALASSAAAAMHDRAPEQLGGTLSFSALSANTLALSATAAPRLELPSGSRIVFEPPWWSRLDIYASTTSHPERSAEPVAAASLAEIRLEVGSVDTDAIDAALESLPDEWDGLGGLEPGPSFAEFDNTQQKRT